MIHTLTHPIVHSIVHPVVGYRIPFARKPLSDIILALFANGEQGAYYDPYDLSQEKLAWVAANPSFTSAQFMAQFPNHTLFQDAAGTIPVTGHSQPVGLVLDKRFGGVRGENQNRDLLVSNYTTLGTGVPITSNTANGLRVENTSEGSMGIFDTAMDFQVNVTYEIAVNIVSVDNMVAEIAVPFEPAQRRTLSVGLNRFIYTPMDSRANRFQLGNASAITAANASFVVSHYSIRPIIGNHASQSLSASRPLWQNNGGIKTFYRDGVDDALNVTLPAATYTRIAANTGTGYASTSVVHGGGALNILGSGAGNSAGYILIDRVLTPTEAANVETLFNTRAGA